MVAKRKKQVEAQQVPPTRPEEQVQGPRFAGKRAANPPPNGARSRQRVPVTGYGTPLGKVIAAGWPRADGSANAVFYDIPGTAANEAETTHLDVTPKPSRPPR